MTTLEATLQAAISHHQSGQLQQAERLYQDVIRLDPRHADALHLLGMASHQRENHGQAVEYVSQAIQANSSFAPYHSTLGAAYRAQGEYSKAITSFQRATELDPRFADGHFNLGVLLLEAGLYAEAAAALEQGLSINPDYAPAWRDLGKILLSQKANENAVACFTQAMQLKPDFLDAYQQLSLVLHDAGRLDESVAAYRAACRLEPELAQAEVHPTAVLAALVDFADAATRSAKPLAAREVAPSATEESIAAPGGMTVDACAGTQQPQTLGLSQVLEAYDGLTPSRQRYQSAVTRHRRAEAVLDHMVAAYEAAALCDDPFAHFYVDALFPEDFYEELLANLPETKYYDELASRDAMLPDGTSARLKLDLDEARIKQLPEPCRSFWLSYLPVFYSDRLKFANFGKFAGMFHAVPKPVLFRDVAGYKILPHPDVPEKKVTTQFYFPRDDSRPHLGTRLYVKDAGDFQEVKQFAFKRNSGYSFQVSDTSWHGVETTTLEDGPRDSLMIVHFGMDYRG